MKKCMPLAMAAAVSLTLGGAPAFAATANNRVEPSGATGSNDVRNIEAQLERTGTATLEKGKTYYLASPIKLTGNLKSNLAINANGATVIAQNNVMTNIPTKSGYVDIKNITVNGGTWKSASSAGFSGTSFGLMHGSNITMKNMKVLHAGYDGHAFEFIACKNVTMDHVTIAPRGKAGKSQETMVQIDIATDATAPRMKGTGLNNGGTCKNVTIKNCNIKGNRAVATGWAYKGPKKYLGKSHSGIKIVNNKLTAYNGEGLALMNVKDAQVKKNTIVSNSARISEVKSSGLHILSSGKIKGATYTVKDNIIKGGLHGIRVWSATSVKLGKVAIKGNRVYCKKGRRNAIDAPGKAIQKLDLSGNKTYSWR